MEGMLLACVFLLMCPGMGTLPKGEPYTWQRPVPGWRQAKETVTLENKGFYFEAAEFEAHFRDQGKLVGELLHFIKYFNEFLSLLSGRAVCGCTRICASDGQTGSEKGNWKSEGSV